MNIRFTKRSITNARTVFRKHSEGFETKAESKKEERLERKNQKLKTMVGELTMELKKRLVKSHHQRSAVVL